MSFDDIPSFPSSDDIASVARKPEDSEASIDKDSPTHLHTQLADFLREKIHSHEWGPRKRIPSEHVGNKHTVHEFIQCQCKRCKYRREKILSVLSHYNAVIVHM